MKLKKLLKSKYAFSAIIASLIMMLLAVAAGVVVYAYVMGWIGGAQQSPTQTGIIQFDSVTADATNDVVHIYVRNVGANTVVLDKVYVAGTSVTANGTGTLAVQGTAYLNATYSMTVSNFYEVKVVCTDGTTGSTSVEAR